MKMGEFIFQYFAKLSTDKMIVLKFLENFTIHAPTPNGRGNKLFRECYPLKHIE